MKSKLTLLLVFLGALSFAQNQDSTNYDMTLEELMNIRITVASKTEMTQRESPAIVSVITKEDIQNMGARDITDILNQIAGFNLGVDVENSIGISARGNWALEGKILLLLDGQEMNELLYANTILGQNYDVTQIERIEIIRGPGSSIYGGYAELGVINIITKDGDQLKGVSAQATIGGGKNSLFRKNVSFSIGDSKGKIQYSIKGFYGKGIRSNQIYTDVFGSSVDLTKNSALDPAQVNANLKAGNFNARLIYDGYSVETVDWYVDIGAKDRVHFAGLYGQTDYKIKAGKKISITPQLNFKTGIPWRVSENSNYDAAYSISATRISPKLTMNWNATENINVVAGIDSYFDKGKLNYYHSPIVGGYFPNGMDYITYHDVGVFAQALIKTNFVNITAGAREDIHNQFGSAFSPRIGITKQISNFHFKLLYSRAFKAPAIENLRVNPDLKPERTGVAELELGYKLNDNMYITGNVFDISITNSIYYFATTSSEANFYNGEKSGSRGFELEYKLKYKWCSINVNYSTYDASGKNKISLYSVPGQNKYYLSAPRGRVNLYSNFKLTKNLTINPSFNFLAKRYGYTTVDNSDNSVLSKFNPTMYFNLVLNYNNLFTNGLNISAGVYNVSDEKRYYIQPYDGWHAPLPSLGREILGRISYSIPFK